MFVLFRNLSLMKRHLIMINKETAKIKLPAGPYTVAVSKTETALNKAFR